MPKPGPRVTPRSKICWECGRKLKLPSFAEVEIDGHMRVVHKECTDERHAKAKVQFYRELENAEEKEAYAIPH